MFQKAFLSRGTLALAVAAVLLSAGPGQAQGRFGGGHFGGMHGSAAVGGFHDGYYRGGYQHYNYRPYDGYRHYNYGYYPYYSYYPDYGSSAWPDTASGPGYATTGGNYPPAYDLAPGLDSSASGTVQSFYPPSGVTQVNTPAQISLRVPANAAVWFDGEKTTSAGPDRQFQSPPLTPGQRYHYEVRARWVENGREVTQTQQVAVSAGANVNVSFPVQPVSEGQAGATK
jgi:uncharacterized protein (TIGR03000 family)